MIVSNSIVRFGFDTIDKITNTTFCFAKLQFKLQEPKHPMKLFTTSRDGSVKQWEIILEKRKFKTLEKVKTLKVFGDWKYSITNMVLDIETSELLFNDGCCDIIQVYNSKADIIQYICASNAVCNMVLYTSHDKKYLIVGLESGQLEFFNWKTKKQIKIIKAYQDWIQPLLVNDQKQELIYVDSDSRITVLCLETFTCLKKFSNCSGVLSHFCFLNYTKTLLASGGCETEIIIWNKETGNPIIIKENAHGGWVTYLLYSLELNLLISCGNDEFVRVWKLNTAATVTNNNSDEILKLDFELSIPIIETCYKMEFINSKTQSQVLVSGHDNGLFVIDLVLKKVIWEKLHTHKDCILSLLVCE